MNGCKPGSDDEIEKNFPINATRAKLELNSMFARRHVRGSAKRYPKINPSIITQTLRERADAIPRLARYFLESFGEKY